MEMAVSTARKDEPELLIIPPLFDEANRMRAQLVLLMRTLRDLGISSVMPDLPGMNESLEPQAFQTLSAWRVAAASAAKHFDVRHALYVRQACVLDTGTAPASHYAPSEPSKLLRAMVRAQSLAEKEAGNDRTASQILDTARVHGNLVAGWEVGRTMAQELCESAEVTNRAATLITHEEIGGRPLWLSNEGGVDESQAQALAKVLAERIGTR